MRAVLDWIDHASESRGIHFSGPGDAWEFRSYAELASEASSISNLLQASNFKRGDVVSLLVSEPREFVPAFFGVMMAGLTPSPIASPVTFQGSDSYAEHVSSILTVARSAAILTDDGLFGIAQTARAATGSTVVRLSDRRSGVAGAISLAPAADIQLLQFTSGSSGTPKGVQVTGENLAANVNSILEWLQVTPEDSCVSWLPLYHDMGLIGAFLGSVVAQVDLWLLSPVDFLRSPLRWLEVLGRRGVTITTSPNFGYAYAARRVKPADLAGFDFSGWRVAMSGAERIDPRAVSAFGRLLEPQGFRPSVFTPCYGLAEGTLAVCGVAPDQVARTVRTEDTLRSGEPVVVLDQGRLGEPDPDDASRLTSCGTPLPGVGVEIVDESGAGVPDGSFGEIAVRGPSVAQGYAMAPGVSSSAFRDGALFTGDSGFLLDGELFVVGRIGDSLKIRGRKVHAEDLETRLAALEQVKGRLCAVALGATGDAQHVVVVVESANTDWLPGLLSVVRSVTDGGVEVTVARATGGSIPRTSSGKPRRRLVWQRFLDGDLPGQIVHGRAADVTATS